MRARPGRESRAQAVRRVPGAGAEGDVSGHSADARDVREHEHGVCDGVLALVFPDPESAAAGESDGWECAGVD